MKLLLENWREYLKEEVYYHGGGKDFLPTRIGTFYSKDKTYAEKYAAQHKDGQVSEVEIDLSQANVYPKVFWWQEFQEIWQPQEMFKGYDIVKVIEPNGEEPSIVVLNPELVRTINENQETWYHGGKIEGDLTPLYLSANKNLSSMHGELNSFKISQGAKWMDLSDLKFSIGPVAMISMDSIGYNEEQINRVRELEYDIVWNKKDFHQGYEQVFVVNPKVLTPMENKL